MTKSEKNKRELSGKMIITYILSIICLVICIIITCEIIDATRKSRPPRIFGISVSYVPSNSMEPTIMTGDYVMYKKSSFKSVEEGDIIIYYSKTNDKYIIHRVEKKYDNYLTAKGDNNPTADSEKVTSDMVYGKYIMTVGVLSIFSGGINKNLIYFILIGIFVIMIGMQVVSMVIKSKTDKITQNSEEEKKLLLEQMKNEILQEELAKLKEKINNKDENKE